MENNIVITSEKNLAAIIKNVLVSFEKEKKAQLEPKLLTINQVSKRLGKAHATIKKYVEAGIIHSTRNGLIPEEAINDYLQR